MNKVDNKKYYYILIGIIIVFVLYDIFSRQKDLKELTVRGEVTSALVVSCTDAGWSSGPYLTFKYTVKNNVFYGKVRSLGVDDYCLFIGRKFQLKYLEEDPSKNEIYMEKEIFPKPEHP